MAQPRITIVIDGQSYALRAADSEALRNVPAAQRRQLIELLEALKQQDDLSQAAVAAALDKAEGREWAVTKAANPGAAPTKQERLGGGDVDELMARLVLEEKHHRKPGLTPQDLYKWLGAMLLLLLVLLLLF